MNFDGFYGKEKEFAIRESIASSYRKYQSNVDAGIYSWMRGDPYEIFEWSRIFTPIESAMWGIIRDAGIPMWPQFPVGRFFLDFGNPVLKIAIECDGRNFHNPIDDSERDFELKKLGWKTFRVPGYECFTGEYDDDGNPKHGPYVRRALSGIKDAISQLPR